VEKQEDGILEMARQQGMNTDVRRSIFVILMTSEVCLSCFGCCTRLQWQDFVHACDRMNALKYSETQQREYVRVTLHCCNLEKTYNPYYTLVLNHLCSESYSHRFTLQYALWDLLRESAGSNVAKTMAYIIARGSMDLTVFKVCLS
jgi:nucleolar MIF4G domain-containing protein 1